MIRSMVKASIDIAHIDVVEVDERNTALDTSLYFAGVVLEAFQRLNLAGVNQFAVTLDANLTVTAQ